MSDTAKWLIFSFTQKCTLVARYLSLHMMSSVKQFPREEPHSTIRNRLKVAYSGGTFLCKSKTCPESRTVPFDLTAFFKQIGRSDLCISGQRYNFMYLYTPQRQVCTFLGTFPYTVFGVSAIFTLWTISGGNEDWTWNIRNVNSFRCAKQKAQS